MGIRLWALKHRVFRVQKKLYWSKILINTFSKHFNLFCVTSCLRCVYYALIAFAILCMCTTDTTDVQRVMVEKGDHYLKIICWFAKGSKAKGCHVHVEVENTYTNVLIRRKTFNITQVY